MTNNANVYAAAIALSILPAAAALLLARQWAPALASFGSELPASAALALSLSHWLLVLPALIAMAWAFHARRSRGLAVGICAATLLLAIACIAMMYRPLFKLAAVA